MVEIVQSGGWLMAPIILCAIIAMGIILERYWTLAEKRPARYGHGSSETRWIKVRFKPCTRVRHWARFSPPA